MRFAGRESWQVGHGTNQAVNTALFLRDTLALSVDTVPELPGLEPSVPVFIPRGVDRAQFQFRHPVNQFHIEKARDAPTRIESKHQIGLRNLVDGIPRPNSVTAVGEMSWEAAVAMITAVLK